MLLLRGEKVYWKNERFFHSAVLLKIISLSSSIKEGHFLKKKKKKGNKSRSTDGDLMSFTLMLHFYMMKLL